MPFFVDHPAHAELVAKWTELSNILDIGPTKEISDDQLVSTTIFTFENSDIASMYFSLLKGNLPEWYFARDAYYAAHGHKLIVTRLNGRGEFVTVFTI
jgi:hypothetical protein